MRVTIYKPAPALRTTGVLFGLVLTLVGLRSQAHTGAAAAGQAAAPPSSRQTFRAATDLVQVDVSVLDKDRKPIRGLTAADFSVLEDGKARPVVAFIPVDLPAHQPDAVLPGWRRDVSPDVTTNDVRPEGRLVVIMFDWSIRFVDQQLAHRIAAAAINQLAPGDQAAVVFTSAFANGGIPQAFTSDHARLLEAVNRPFAVALINPPYGATHDGRNKNGVMLDDPEGYQIGDCYCRLCVPEAITRVADAVREVPGRRKSLLFIGTFFQGYEGLNGPTSRRNLSGGGGAASAPLGGPGLCTAQLDTVRNTMVRAASLANLTIHTLDPVGMESEGNSPMGGGFGPEAGEKIRERQDGLSLLADFTGGRTVMNTNTPDEQIPAIFDESSSYYVLGFAPFDPKATGKFHKIDVKVDRPGVTLRTRAGYYAGETHVASKTPTIVSPDASGALSGLLPRTDMPLSVSAVPLGPVEQSSKGEVTVAIMLGVRDQIIPGRPRGSAPVKIVAGAFDRNGKPVQLQEQTVALERRPNDLTDRMYEVLSRLTLKPGRYEVRVGVEASADQRASVYTFVEVPDFTQPLSLSGVVLAVTPPVASAPPDAFKDLLPIVPTSRRIMARTDHATAFVRLYQGGKDALVPVTVSARIVDAHEGVRVEQRASLAPTQFATRRAANYGLDLPLERLEPGEYLLTIDGTRDRATANRNLRFTVR
jgi:VWFA-related protein